MNAKVFLDTNILLYAISAAPSDQTKSRKAQELMLSAPFGLSAQVVMEFIANALKKKSLGISEENIGATLLMASEVEVLPLTLPLILAARELRRRFQLSHWDSTILAAAQEMGCDVLYSEDFSNGQTYDGVKIINPFQGL